MSDPFAASRTITLQAPLSMGFSRQEYWSGLPFPSPGDLPNPGIEPTSPALAGGFFTTEPPGKPLCKFTTQINHSINKFLRVEHVKQRTEIYVLLIEFYLQEEESRNRETPSLLIRSGFVWVDWFGRRLKELKNICKLPVREGTSHSVVLQDLEWTVTVSIQPLCN